MSAVRPPAQRAASRRRARRRARASRGTILLGVASVVYVLAGLAVATALAWPIYRIDRLVLVAAVAAVPAVGIPLLARRRGWPMPIGVALVALAYLVLVVPLAIPSAMTSPADALLGLRDGLTGVVLGWKQLLTLQLPVGDYQAVLVPFLLVALVGTSSATALGLASGRRAVCAVPLVLAMAVFGIAFGSTAGGAGIELAGMRLGSVNEVVLGVVVLGLSLAWLVLRARLSRRAALERARASADLVVTSRAPIGAIARRRMLAAAVLVGALLIAVVATPAVAVVTPRSTLRTGTEPMLVVRDQTSPLAQYRASFTGGAFTEPLFRVSVSGAGAGAGAGVDRIRLGVLDAWDGEDFVVGTGDSGRFVRLPGGSAPAGSSTVHVTVERGLTGIWMPLPDGVSAAPVFTGPRAASLADGFYLDRDSGAGIEIAPDGSGVRGLQAGDGYTVQVAPTKDAQLGAPGAASLVDQKTLPELTAWIKAQDQPRTASGFDELITRLRDRGYLTHSLTDDSTSAAWISALKAMGPYGFQAAYAGHSTAREEALFTQLLDQQRRVGADADPGLLVAGVGDDEQFAAAAALIARAVGYESRVVVGVRLTPLSGSGVAPCSTTCTGGELAAWVEVRSPGAATWTTVDAEPQHSTLPTLVTTGQQLPKNATVPQLPAAGTVQPPTAQHNDGDSQKSAHSSAALWWAALLPVLRVVALALAAVLLLLLPALVLLCAKRMRRSARRRASVPEVAVVGAWAETVDAWADAGVEVGAGTRRDQAARLGSAAAARLAQLVDRAVFGEHPPTRGAADEAWRLAEEELARRRSMLGRMRVLRAALTPASFLRALGRSPVPTEGRR